MKLPLLGSLGSRCPERGLRPLPSPHSPHPSTQTLASGPLALYPASWKSDLQSSTTVLPVCPKTLLSRAPSTMPSSAQGSACGAAEPSLTPRGHFGPNNGQGSRVALREVRLLPGTSSPSTILQSPGRWLCCPHPGPPGLRWGQPKASDPSQLCPLGPALISTWARMSPSSSPGPAPPGLGPDLQTPSTNLSPPWAGKPAHSSPRSCPGHSCVSWHTWG